MIFPSDQAKIEDTIESKYAVRPELFNEFCRAAYERGVAHADKTEAKLRNAIKHYAEAVQWTGSAYDIARQHFWTRVEQSLAHLFAVAEKLAPPDQLAASPWGKAVHAAARAAYERTCPRRNPRQIQAYALGLRHLFFSASAPKTKKAKTKATVSP